MLAARLRRAGRDVALMPRDWARAAAGGCAVVGSRAAAWAPLPSLSAAVVVDEHDEAYQEERAPTWNARDVVIERARRAGVPCTLVSPCPSLAALAVADVVADPGRAEERGGWPVLEVADRRADEPGRGLYSDRLVELVRAAAPGQRVVCVLNRKGRAVLLACASCAELARCEVCDGPLEAPGGGVLRCRRCGAEQPPVCRWCGSARFKALRIGVARVREELELLAGQPVAEVTGEAGSSLRSGAQAGQPVSSASVIVGTEAVLHRVAGAHVVAFLDFDQELLAPRYRAGEQALVLLARAGRLVGGRDWGRGGRVLVQTRLPGHEVLDAARHGDPSRFAVVEAARRAALRLPPETALARLSGPGAVEIVDAVRTTAGVEVLGPSGDRWLVRAPGHRVLCDGLASAPRPAARVRVEVDPLRA
jgi:primosomal protein N' (replication factor Y)